MCLWTGTQSRLLTSRIIKFPLLMESDNCRLFKNLMKISKCWRHDVKRLMKRLIITMNLFPASSFTCQNKWTTKRTQNPNNSLHSSFEFWKTSIRCPILSYFNNFSGTLVVSWLMQINLMIQFSVICSQNSITCIFCCLHLIEFASSLVLLMSNLLTWSYSDFSFSKTPEEVHWTG